MILLSFLTFVLSLHVVFADVLFTSPGAGANVPVGPLTVRWKNSGRPPSIAGLTVYTLDLVVGGNNVGDFLPIQTFVTDGDYTNPWVAKAVVLDTVAAEIPNGFFFRMVSTSSNGGVIYNYSDRFTITGLNGTTASEYRNAAEALHGNTSGPPRGGNVPAITSGSSSSAAPTKTPGQTVTITKDGQSHSGTALSGKSNNGTGPGGGVIAGVVILCLAFFVGAIGLGVWAHMRRKRRRRNSSDLDNKDELSKQPSVTTLSELSADGKAIELGDGLPPPEMDSTTIRAELEGDCAYEASETPESPWETRIPLTPIASSINGEETLCNPTSPMSTI